MSGSYILDADNNPIIEPDSLKWADWFEHANRTVCLDKTPKGIVSTVFLSIDHQFGDGPPLLFETMVFDTSSEDEIQYRYETRQEAIEGHNNIVMELRA